MPTETKESNPFAKINAIQVQIDENVRMMAQLHARWEREKELAKEDNIPKVFTITTLKIMVFHMLVSLLLSMVT